MRTPIEIIDYLDERIKQSGMYKADVLKKAGYSITLFIMAKQRNSYLRVETMIELGRILNVSLTDILDIKEDAKIEQIKKTAELYNNLPEDIKRMIDMLQSISPENRKMIGMNIENYFNVEQQNKDKSSL